MPSVWSMLFTVQDRIRVEEIAERFPCNINADSPTAFQLDTWLQKGCFVRITTTSSPEVKNVGLALPVPGSSLPLPFGQYNPVHIYLLHPDNRIHILGGQDTFDVLHPGMSAHPTPLFLLTRYLSECLKMPTVFHRILSTRHQPLEAIDQLKLGMDIACWVYDNGCLPASQIGELLNQCITDRPLEFGHSSESTMLSLIRRLAACRPLVRAIVSTNLLSNHHPLWYKSGLQTLGFLHCLERLRMYTVSISRPPHSES